MRKIFLGVLIALLATSCNQKKIDHLTYQVDSVIQVKNKVEEEKNYFLQVIAEVQSNFEQIKTSELGIIDQSQSTEGISTDDKALIQQNFDLIRNKLQENRDKIAQIEEDLKKSKGEVSAVRAIVKNLRLDLEKKSQEIELLKNQLLEKDAKILELDSMVVSLNQTRDSLNMVAAQQISAIQAQDEELNTAWYIIGTKKELKSKGLKEGDLKTANVNKSIFTKIDIRDFAELDLGSKKAKLYTSHPASSYSLTKKSDKDKELMFKIKDYPSFWSNSRILVIQIK
jgi:chromosome segregation ATPase